MRKKVMITGARGDWTAAVEGRRLAVIHTTWRVGADGYHDPMKGANTAGARYRAVLLALHENDEVALQRDAPDGSLARDGYVSVSKFEALEVAEDGAIRLRLVGRTADPR